MAGTLYLVATPIGNLDDITLRALKVLQQVDLIAAEDTRVSAKLLHHYEIKKPLLSYYEHNKAARGPVLIEKLLAGQNIALVSDAGTPCLSDPGQELVCEAIANEIAVVPLPGASALLAALVVSGLDSRAFAFEGFLPRSKAARKKVLTKLASEERTLIFYEAPHHLLATLDDLIQHFGAEREACVCRELTKLYEQTVRGTLAVIRDAFQQTPPRGEFVILVSGFVASPAAVRVEDVAEEFLELLASDMPRRQAAKQLAEKYQLNSKEVYAIGLDD